MLAFIIFIISICLIFGIELYSYNPPALFGIYSRANGYYWLKYFLIKIVLLIRKKRSKLTEQNIKECEQLGKIPNFDKTEHAIYFKGSNKSGDHLLITTNRIPNCLDDGYLHLKINSKFGVFESPKLLITTLKQDAEHEGFAAEDLQITPLVPNNKWAIAYEGLMKESTNEKVTHRVKINGTWISNLPYFDIDSDIETSLLASAIAKERWSLDYFKNLKKSLELYRQFFHEQFGNLQVETTIDDEQFELKLETVRTHSIGTNKDWRLCKRYVKQWFSCSNGDRFSFTVICMPMLFSELIVGYVYSSKQQKILPLTDCDFKIYQHGHLGEPPKEYGFSFTAGGKYSVHVSVTDQLNFYNGKERECRIFECLSKYIVNGDIAWGCAEWVYRNV